MNINNVLISPIVSEKSTGLAEEKVSKYTFVVDKKATKGEIKIAIKKFMDVDVIDIKTLIIPGKEKRVMSKTRRTYRKPSTKKAIVTLKEGQKLELFGK